ncbi:hypothetical protein GCM10029964_049460 [Kibdelosporangium lantanae]
MPRLPEFASPGIERYLERPDDFLEEPVQSEVLLDLRQLRAGETHFMEAGWTVPQVTDHENDEASSVLLCG